MQTQFVILTVEQAAELRRHLVSPIHNEWLRCRVIAPLNLRQLGLSNEQIEAINAALAAILP
jgi:hypothetical protein